MTHDDWMSVLRMAIGVALPPLALWLIASVTGLIDHGREWLVARKQNQLAAVVGMANTMLQSAMENSAGNLALAIRQGRLDPASPMAMKNWALREAGLIGEKLPAAVMTAQATDQGLTDGITGKVAKVLPLVASAPTAAASSSAPSTTDRRSFFDAVRVSVFGGRMVQSQVDGCNHVLDHWAETTPSGDVRHLAYILATDTWETGRTMQPVEEIGRGAGRFYGASGFYGRGLVQVSLEPNYRKMSPVAGCDLVASPERALEWPIALRIMFFGMANGMFTGRKLGDYFNAVSDDPVGARAIVNGSDRAIEIAALYHGFLAALNDVAGTQAMAA